MKKISVEEQKNIEVKILLFLTKFCDENNLKYYLSGGTLIGAVRHKGFIPWDDDIDIFMPRKDYMMLIAKFPEGYQNLKLLSHYTNIKFGQTFIKVMDCDTVLKETHLKTCDIGVNIDIFPIDNLGNTQEDAKKMERKLHNLRELAWLSINKHMVKTESLFKNILKRMAFIVSKIIGTDRLIQKLEKKARKFENCETKFVGCCVSGYGEREVVNKDIFNTTIDVEFEGYKFKAPGNFHEYLTSMYGNYMELPPENLRITHHNYIAYVIDRKRDLS